MIYFIDFLMVVIKTAAKIVNKSEIAKYFRCFFAICRYFIRE